MDTTLISPNSTIRQTSADGIQNPHSIDTSDKKRAAIISGEQKQELLKGPIAQGAGLPPGEGTIAQQCQADDSWLEKLEQRFGAIGDISTTGGEGKDEDPLPLSTNETHFIDFLLEPRPIEQMKKPPCCPEEEKDKADSSSSTEQKQSFFQQQNNNYWI